MGLIYPVPRAWHKGSLQDGLLLYLHAFKLKVAQLHEVRLLDLTFTIID